MARGNRSQNVDQTPKLSKNIFRYLSRGHRFTCRGQIWWKWAVGRCQKVSFTGLPLRIGLVRASIFVPLDRSHPLQHFLNYNYYKCRGFECCNHIVAGALYKNLDLKLLHSSMQTSADYPSIDGATSAVWLTKKVRLGLPPECQKWGAGPSL